MSAFGGKTVRRVAAYDRKVDAQEISKIIHLAKIIYLAMQSFMNLFQRRNLIFSARACFLQLDHFWRPSSCLIRDFSAPLSTKGAGEKTEGGVWANAMPPTRTEVIAKTAGALTSRSINISIPISYFCELNSLSTTHACVNRYAAALKRT